nr:glycosyltransferase family 9 protein [Candidatus Omnitrophota bacterium]
MELKLDCKFYKGDKPCLHNRFCENCPYYEPMGKRILIIKLGSIGDVLRTTPLLYGIKNKYPESHITWLTNSESVLMLEGNNLIDRLLVYNLDSALRLQVEEFGIVINLDKEKNAASLAELIKAKEKFGYGLNKEGNLYPLNREAEYGFSLGLLDELKFRVNKKSYQEIIFETIGLAFGNEEYILNLDKSQKNFRDNFLNKRSLNKNDFKIGLNTGCGLVFPYKKWTESGFTELIDILDRKLNVKILLLGGANEEMRNKEILSKTTAKILDTGHNNNLKEFIAIVDCCDLIVTADTLALHLAIALKKKVVALFGPTCAQEIELYGRGIKIISQKKCAPCYKKECFEENTCMDLITPQEVFSAIERLATYTEVSEKL